MSVYLEYGEYADLLEKNAALQKENKELKTKLNDALRKNVGMYSLVCVGHDYGVSLQDKVKSLEEELHDLTIRVNRLRDKNIDLNKRYVDLLKKVKENDRNRA